VRHFFIQGGQNSRQKGSEKDLIATLLLAIPSFWPGLASIAQFFLPGVAANLLCKNPIKKTLSLLFIVFIVGSILAIFIASPGVPLILGQSIVIAGIILLSLEKGISGPETLIALTISLIVMDLTLMGILTGGDLKTPYNSILNSMLSEYDKGIALYKESYGKDLPIQMQAVVQSIRQTLITYMPGLLCAYLFFIGLLNILTFEKLSIFRGLPRLGPDFEKWQMPEQFVWLFICFGFMALFPQEEYNIIGKNGVFVTSLFYLIQGFSIIKYFFKVYQTPLFARILIYILIGIQWYGLLLIVFTGLMDTWFNFRSKIKGTNKVS